MKDKKRIYNLSYFMKYGGSNSSTRVPFKIKNRNKGKQSQFKEKGSLFNKGIGGLTGLSKLSKGPENQGKSKQYAKAERSATAKAHKIAEELEQQFSSGMKASSIFQRQEEIKKRAAKIKRIERKKLDEKSQRNASVFIQSMHSEEFSQDDLLKNFCRINNEEIQESIIFSAFIPKFLSNINEIKTFLEKENKLETLTENYYKSESSYKKFFELFIKLQENGMIIDSIFPLLQDMNMGPDHEELKKLIDNINNNGFNLELSFKLRDWINNFKDQGFKYYKINPAEINKDFVFEEDNVTIEDTLKKFLIKTQLLGIKEELDSTTLRKIYTKISNFTHEDKLSSDIESIKTIIKGDGTISRLQQKYEKGYFSEQQIIDIFELLKILAEKLKSLKQDKETIEKEMNDKEIELTDNAKEKLRSLKEYIDTIEKEIKEKEKELTTDNAKEKELTTDNAKEKLKSLKQDKEAAEKEMKNKEKELTKELDDFIKQKVNILDKLYKQTIDDEARLFKELDQGMKPIYSLAMQNLGNDYKKLIEYFNSIDKTQQSAGNGNANAAAKVNAAFAAAANTAVNSKVNAAANPAVNPAVNTAANPAANPAVNVGLKEKILGMHKKQLKEERQLGALDFSRIYKKSVIKFFIPLEYLINKYIEICANYKKLFDVFEIRTKLYFKINIYSRLKSNDKKKYSCTSAFICNKILNIDEIMSSDENILLEYMFIESLKGYCKDTNFFDDASLNINTSRLFKAIVPGLEAPASLLRMERVLAIEDNREKNREEREERERKRQEVAKQQKLNEVNRLFAELKKLAVPNFERELTLDELRELKVIKGSLIKILDKLDSTNKQNERAFLNNFNINNQIKHANFQRKRFEMTKLLDEVERMLQTNEKTLKITEVKSAITRLEKINNEILYANNKKKVNDLQKGLRTIYNSRTNANDYQDRKEEYNKEIQELMKNNIDELLEKELVELDVELIKETISKLEKILKIIKILQKFAPVTDQQQLSSEFRFINEKLGLMKEKERKKLTEIGHNNESSRVERERAEKEEKDKKRKKHIRAMYTKLNDELKSNGVKGNKIDKSLERLREYKVRNKEILRKKNIDEIDRIIEELQKLQKPKEETKVTAKKDITKGLTPDQIVLYNKEEDPDGSDTIKYKNILNYPTAIFLDDSFIQMLYDRKPKTDANRSVTFLKKNEKKNLVKKNPKEEAKEKEEIKENILKSMKSIMRFSKDTELHNKYDQYINPLQNEINKTLNENRSFNANNPAKIKARKLMEKLDPIVKNRDIFIKKITMSKITFFTRLKDVINKQYGYGKKVLEMRKKEDNFIIYLF